MDTARLKQLAGIVNEATYAPSDDIHTKAIAVIDDMLDALPKDEQYGERADIFRHILKVLQK